MSRCEDYPCCGHGEGGCPSPPQPKREPRLSLDAMLGAMEKERPHLAAHLEADRFWLWYCGPCLRDKPADREWMHRHGWQLGKAARNGGGHAMPSGAMGSWYFWDSIPPKHGRSFGRRSNSNGNGYKPASTPPPAGVLPPPRRHDYIGRAPMPKPQFRIETMQGVVVQDDMPNPSDAELVALVAAALEGA